MSRYRTRQKKVEAIEFDGSVKCVNAIANWTQGLIEESIKFGTVWLKVQIPGNGPPLSLGEGMFLVKRENGYFATFRSEEFWKLYEEEEV